jgi:serine/threonine-protein kinase
MVMHPTAGANLADEARFGPYLLTERIGRGGMAAVYKARIEGPNGFAKTVVVKRLLAELTAKPEFLELFTAEAKTTAQLSHPGIVQVFDFGIIGETPYLVMEYVDGINLAQLLKQVKARGERVPVDIAVILLTQVCHALAYAHSFRDANGRRVQIVHGDVSPANIMICRDGTAKLLDFGVARVLGEFDFELTHTLRGKFAYLAPEQIRRGPFDRRVDVFAAGIVLHELLTGDRLFHASTDKETLLRVHAARVEPPSRVNPTVKPELDAIVLKALARDPNDRFESGEAMAGALEQVARIRGGRRLIADYIAPMMEAQAHDTAEAHDTQLMEPPLKPPPPPLRVVPPPPPTPVPSSVMVQPLTSQAPPVNGVAPPVNGVAPPVNGVVPLKKPRPASITEVVALPPKVTPVPPRSRSRKPVAASLAVALAGFTVGGAVALSRRAVPAHPVHTISGRALPRGGAGESAHHETPAPTQATAPPQPTAPTPPVATPPVATPPATAVETAPSAPAAVASEPVATPEPAAAPEAHAKPIEPTTPALATSTKKRPTHATRTTHPAARPTHVHRDARPVDHSEPSSEGKHTNDDTPHVGDGELVDPFEE